VKGWDLKHFKPAEFKSPEKMDHWFLRQLDQWRDITLKSCNFTITESYAKDGHSEDSYHYKGQAVDGYISFQGKRLSTVEQFILAMRSPFHGIGIYTWSPNGCFLHLDCRPTFERKIWVCEKKGTYENLNASFLGQISSI
jgi:uncharacterized protein YcbK (DUF882 family)